MHSGAPLTRIGLMSLSICCALLKPSPAAMKDGVDVQRRTVAWGRPIG